MLLLNATLRSATIKDEMLWYVTRNDNALIHILHTSYDSRKMRLPLYVCANCAQTFTRRSSASRHNSNLHFNQGIIVQMLEYIIGRSCGHFLPPNQLSNRQFRRPTFTWNQKMNNIESGFGATVHEASHRLSNKITQNESYSVAYQAHGLANQPLSIDFCIYSLSSQLSQNTETS